LSEIGTIFQKPPLEWSRADLESAIAWFKEHRGHLDLIKKDGSVKRKAKAKDAQIDLDELIKEISP